MDGVDVSGERIRFEVLRGGVDALHDGRSLRLGGAQRRLLAGLLADVGNSVSIDRLVEIVWPGADVPAGARRTVMSYVSRLRALVGHHRITTTAGGYRLSLDDASFDAVEFEDLLTVARVDEGRAVVLLDAALAPWAGRAFGELGDESWIRAVAARLDELHLVALGERADRSIDAGNAAATIADLEALVIEHPLREPFVGSLMRALAADGRHAEALRVARAYRTRLADETGLDPSGALVELEHHIASGDGSPLPTWGQVLPGYTLGELIGQNALGAVYRARQEGVTRDVAVGVIRPDLADDPAFIELFDAEARLVAGIEHPHVVPLYDVRRRPGGAFLVFRYLGGGTLAERIAEGPLATGEVTQLVHDIGGALSAAHERGVVHRDLKPANIVFDARRHAYLANFGIAALEGAAAGRHLAPVGVPSYTSPEQILERTVTARSDQYAFAVVLFEALVGSPPFAGASANELMAAKLAGGCPPAGTPFDDVLTRATQPDPAQRYPDVAAFAAAWVAAGNTR
jgi:DNA-binding SARP family transcriptional activator